MRVPIAWLLDLLLLATTTVIAFVVVTGGGVDAFGGVRVSVHTVDNAITAVTVL